MIDSYRASKYCCEDISQIENYDKAIADTTQTWQIHHRDEIRTLPSGMVVYRTQQELIENGRYYNCPANELIFLTKSEHIKLHCKYRPPLPKECYERTVRTRKNNGYLHHSEETKRKLSEARKGKSSWNKGKHYKCEAVSKALKGHKLSDKTKEKMSKSRIGRKWYNDGVKDYFIYPEQVTSNLIEGILYLSRHITINKSEK